MDGEPVAGTAPTTTGSDERSYERTLAQFRDGTLSAACQLFPNSDAPGTAAQPELPRQPARRRPNEWYRDTSGSQPRGWTQQLRRSAAGDTQLAWPPPAFPLASPGVAHERWVQTQAELRQHQAEVRREVRQRARAKAAAGREASAIQARVVSVRRVTSAKASAEHRAELQRIRADTL